MARILLSAIVTSIRGKMGGTVFQDSYTSFQSKNLARVHDPRTPVQSQRRISFGSSSNAWNLLSDIERASWNEFKDPGISGYNTFLRVNARLASVGASMMSSYSDDTPPVSMFIALTTLSSSAISIEASGLTTTVPNDCLLSVRMSRVVSPGITFLPAGQLKQFIIFNPATDLSSPVDVTTAYTTGVGPLTAGRRVFVQALVQNYVTGRATLGQRNTQIIAP